MSISMTQKAADPKEKQVALRQVNFEQGFHFFYASGEYSGETAVSLLIFKLDLEKIDVESIRYHLSRKDFQKWILEVIGDEKLADEIDSLEIMDSDTDLRHHLVDLVEERIAELSGDMGTEESLEGGS